MRIVIAAVVTPILVGPFVASMVMAMNQFQSTYGETLCRMEAVRTHALENIMRDEPITPDFGGDACLTPVLPTIALELEELTPTATPAP